MTQWTIWYQSV